MNKMVVPILVMIILIQLFASPHESVKPQIYQIRRWIASVIAPKYEHKATTKKKKTSITSSTKKKVVNKNESERERVIKKCMAYHESTNFYGFDKKLDDKESLRISSRALCEQSIVAR